MCAGGVCACVCLCVSMRRACVCMCVCRTCTHCSASASELVLNTRFLSQKMHQQVPPTRCRVVRGALAWAQQGVAKNGGKCDSRLIALALSLTHHLSPMPSLPPLCLGGRWSSNQSIPARLLQLHPPATGPWHTASSRRPWSCSTPGSGTRSQTSVAATDPSTPPSAGNLQ